MIPTHPPLAWQPIDTAPKDRRVLLYYPQRFPGVVCGFWEAEEYAKKPRPHWRNDKSHMHVVHAIRDNQPTHWMALPDAPSHDNPGWSDPLEAQP
jgi:hypothetical protein